MAARRARNGAEWPRRLPVGGVRRRGRQGGQPAGANDGGGEDGVELAADAAGGRRVPGAAGARCARRPRPTWLLLRAAVGLRGKRGGAPPPPPHDPPSRPPPLLPPRSRARLRLGAALRERRRPQEEAAPQAPEQPVSPHRGRTPAPHSPPPPQAAAMLTSPLPARPGCHAYSARPRRLLPLLGRCSGWGPAG